MPTLSPSLALAVADMLGKADSADSADSPDAALGWRHAALITRNGWDTPRKLKQLRQHARHQRETAGNPVKAAAYREAIAIITHHTGEDLAAEIVRESYAQGDLALAT